MSRERILRIAALFGVAFALLGFGLFQLQVLEHDTWLERSFRNRWAFKDVPTRRGEIVDRHGVPLAWDAPGFDLELTYLTFRRSHPVALVLHAAELLHEARDGGASYSFERPDQLVRGLDDLLASPVGWFRESSAWPRARQIPGYGDDAAAGPMAVARDVRIQTVRAVAELAGISRSELAKLFLRAVRDPQQAGTVGEVIQRIASDDPEMGELHGTVEQVVARLGERMAERVDELGRLDARLWRGAEGRDEWQLWPRLERAHAEWRDWRHLSSLPEAEAEALASRDFWRYLYEQRFEWQRWQDWLALPAPRREELIVSFGVERARREGAREEQLAGIERFVDPSGTDRGDGSLFAPLPGELAAPRFVDEVRPQRIRSRISHEVAVWIALLDERHPGLSLRPSVRRERGRLPGRDDLSSLQGLVGTVGTYSPRGRSAGLDAVRRLGDADEFARLDDEFPDDLEASARRSAAGALRRHLAIFGRVGRSGIEAEMDDVLTGRPGLRFVEQDKRARETRMFERLDVSPGAPITATVDVRLQQLAEDAVGMPSADSEIALALLDPWTGDVLALVGRRNRTPKGDDPGGVAWSVGAMPVTWSPYVGSVAKPLVALEYLRSVREQESDAVAELVDPVRFPACEWKWEPSAEIPYRGRTLYCSSRADRHDHLDGSQHTSDAIAKSCNIYFFEAASRLGPQGLLRAYARFGWDPTDDAHRSASVVYQDRIAGMIKLVGGGPSVEENSAFPVPKRGIGYGLRVWPVFVARAYAGIATGALPRLRVVREVAAASTPLPYTADEFGQVREGLALCVREGTARRQLADFAARLAGVHGVTLYGKTGTAEVVEARRGASGGSLNNAWFAGYVAEGGAPRLAFAAVVYRSTDSGGQVAAPIVRDLLERIAEDRELAAEYLHGGGE